MALAFSRWVAMLIGILAPVLQTIRLWHYIHVTGGSRMRSLNVWPFRVNDYVLGALLLYGAYRAGQDARQTHELAAALGFACGLLYHSFFYQLSISRSDAAKSYIAPISSAGIAAIKGLGLALATAALVATLQWSPE